MNTDPDQYRAALHEHYGKSELASSIIEALRRIGADPDSPTRDDLAAADEFHIGGRRATRALAELASLASGMRVLDLGCGIGGPARTLAAEFGCHVTGIDVVPEYIETARLLSRLTGLVAQTRFECADVSALDASAWNDWAAAPFDFVWLQHVLPNIPEKPRLFAELRGRLAPHGCLAVYDICTGPGGPPHFPLPWATDAALSFTISPDGLRQQLTIAGFQELEWHDVSVASLEWFREAVAARRARKSEAPRAPDLRLLMGDSAADKSRNMVRNLEDKRIAVVMGLFERRG